MPSLSKAQQKLFGIAEHNPEALHAENKGLADLPHKTLHEFAATKTKDLPEHVKTGPRYKPNKVS